MKANNYDRAKLRLQTFSIVRERGPSAPAVTSSEVAGSALVAIFDKLDHDCEHFVVLALNVRYEPVGYKVVSSGTATACLVHAREVFRAALFLGATGIICAHNHPSGSPEPSSEDMTLAYRLNDAGKLLGIPVLDHLVVITSNRIARGLAVSYQQALGASRPSLGDSK